MGTIYIIKQPTTSGLCTVRILYPFDKLMVSYNFIITQLGSSIWTPNSIIKTIHGDINGYIECTVTPTPLSSCLGFDAMIEGLGLPVCILTMC